MFGDKFPTFLKNLIVDGFLGVRGKLDVEGDIYSNGVKVLTQGQLLGYAGITTLQTGFSNADLTGLSVTVTTDGTQSIKITGYASFGHPSTSTNYGELSIKEGSTTLQKYRAVITVPSASIPTASAHPVVRLTPSAGSHTYKLNLAFYRAGNGFTGAASDEPCFILVEKCDD